MAPLAPNLTQRWFYTYQNARNAHEFTIRGTDLATLADADALVASILSAIGNRFASSTITKVEHSGIGGNVRFGVVSDRLGDEFGSGAPNPVQDATELTFTGKTENARRWRFGIFGWMSDVGDFRQTSSEDAEVAAVVNLWAADSPVNVGIDGLKIFPNAYGNIKPNDHWVKKSRS